MIDIDVLEKYAVLTVPEEGKALTLLMFENLRKQPRNTYNGGVLFVQKMQKELTKEDFVHLMNGLIFGLVSSYMIDTDKEFRDVINEQYGKNKGENIVDFLAFRGKR